MRDGNKYRAMLTHTIHTIRHHTDNAVTGAKDMVSIRGIILTALITMITTGTFQFLTDQALQAEREYWAKYSTGAENKTRMMNAYLKTLSHSCGN